MCQLKLSRLNFNANTEDECLHNLRCVEQGLRRCKINKELPLRRLSKGNFQDTFELLQWCYNYLHTHYPDADYNYPAYDIRQKAGALVHPACACRLLPSATHDDTTQCIGNGFARREKPAERMQPQPRSCPRHRVTQTLSRKATQSALYVYTVSRIRVSLRD